MRDIELQQILASFSPNLKKVKCNLLELCALFSSFGRICRELKNKNVFFSVFIFSSEIHFYKFNQQNHIIFKIVSCLSLDKIILFFLFFDSNKNYNVWVYISFLISYLFNIRNDYLFSQFKNKIFLRVYNSIDNKSRIYSMNRSNCIFLRDNENTIHACFSKATKLTMANI